MTYPGQKTVFLMKNPEISLSVLDDCQVRTAAEISFVRRNRKRPAMRGVFHCRHVTAAARRIRPPCTGCRLTGAAVCGGGDWWVSGFLSACQLTKGAHR